MIEMGFCFMLLIISMFMCHGTGIEIQNTDINLTTMKNFILCIGLLFFLQGGLALNKTTDTKSTQPLKGTLRVFTTPDLYPLTIHWADEFSRLNPGVQMRCQSTGIHHCAECNSSGNLAFVSSVSNNSLQDSSHWNTIVGRDVIVPVLNANNPLSECH